MKSSPGGPVVLRTMSVAEFADYLARCAVDYAAELVRSGAVPDEAAAHARAVNDTAEVRAVGPDGDRHRVYAVEDRTGGAVGVVWLGARAGWAETWIYDIRVEPSLQGRGLGRATLQAAERRAVELGAQRIGLHVFADNTVARRLYASSGYVETEVLPTDVVMWKELATARG